MRSLSQIIAMNQPANPNVLSPRIAKALQNQRPAGYPVPPKRMHWYTSVSHQEQADRLLHAIHRMRVPNARVIAEHVMEITRPASKRHGKNHGEGRYIIRRALAAMLDDPKLYAQVDSSYRLQGARAAEIIVMRIGREVIGLPEPVPLSPAESLELARAAKVKESAQRAKLARKKLKEWKRELKKATRQVKTWSKIVARLEKRGL